jgi:hypothetical protein
LNPALLPPAFTIDINGENSVCTNTQSPQVENIFRKGSDGKWYILSMNSENQAANNIQFSVLGLSAGEEIQVLFENRNITAGAGTFQDNFPAYGRHVYQISALTPIKEPLIASILTLDKFLIYNNNRLHAVTFILKCNVNAPLKIYNIQGRLVNTLPGTGDGKQVTWVWKRKDSFGKEVSRNVYFARIKVGSNKITKRFVLIK